MFVFLLFSSQNDHLAAERQADDPAEQGQGVPPEIPAAVFLNCHVPPTYGEEPTNQNESNSANQN